MGKFDGFDEDDFEPMLVKIHDSILYIRADEEIPEESEDILFDLMDETAHIHTNPNDPLNFYLLHDDKKILFQVCIVNLVIKLF